MKKLISMLLQPWQRIFYCFSVDSWRTMVAFDLLVSSVQVVSVQNLLSRSFASSLSSLFRSIELRFVMQARPFHHTLYGISVRQTKGLPQASFRFHLAVDTLAFG